MVFLNCHCKQVNIFYCVGKVIDNNDDAALLEEREELVERQDLGMRQRIKIKMLSIYLLFSIKKLMRNQVPYLLKLFQHYARTEM